MQFGDMKKDRAAYNMRLFAERVLPHLRSPFNLGRNIMKRSIAVLAASSGFAIASLLALPAARAADVFTLTSPAIPDNGTLAIKNACSDKQRSPNCVGENISPPLAWSNPPEGTKSYALLLFDPEGRAPAGVSHMVIYGIPADVKGFAEGELSKPSDKFVGGKSLMGLGTYFGPGTPPNTDWHHYTWTIVATDLDPKALQPGMTRDELAKALDGHQKGSAGLVTRFRHPT
jgi:Raf kinase inhibitor-like YbhB/YbcL family protein